MTELEKVYRNDRLMFKVMVMLQLNLCYSLQIMQMQVRHKFNAQLSQRENCKWKQEDEKST